MDKAPMPRRSRQSWWISPTFALDSEGQMRLPVWLVIRPLSKLGVDSRDGCRDSHIFSKFESCRRPIQSTIMKKALIAITLALSSLSANAENYGRWICSSCNIKSDVLGGQAVIQGEIVAFLRSNAITNRWQPNDVITVCDGVMCVPIVWRTTAWYSLGPPYSDTPNDGYKNSTVSGTSSSGTGLYYSIAVTGHWEWWDHYSNGIFVGSSFLEFIIDSISVSYTDNPSNNPRKSQIH